MSGNVEHRNNKIANSKEAFPIVHPKTEIRKDGGWSWIVCISAALVQFVVLGIHNSFGILYIVFLKEYGWGKALTGYIGSMGLGMNFFFGPLTSTLCDRFGCKIVAIAGGIVSVIAMVATSFVSSPVPIYITYSITWGLGSSMSYVPTFLILDRYFEHRKSLAHGIVTAGSSVGALVIGPTINVLVESVGWRHTMRILGAFACVMIVAAFSYRAPPVKSKMCKGEKKIIDLAVWKNKGFVVWALALGIFNLGYFIPFVYLPTHATYHEIPQSKASFLIGFLSVGSLAGRLLFGHVSDYRCVNRMYLYQSAFLIMAVTATLCPLATNYGGLVLFTILFGIFDGVVVTLTPVITGDIVGSNKLSSALGFLYLVFSIPLMTGSLIAGFLSEITSTYNEAFFFSGGMIAVCACILSLVPVLTPMRQHGVTEIKMRSNSFREKKEIPLFVETHVFLEGDPFQIAYYSQFLERETDV